MNQELKEGWFTVPPPAEEGEARELLEALKLEDGSPLYHMFFDPSAITVSASEAHTAKTRLSVYIRVNETFVLLK